jgi:hypothetical protein
MMEMFLGKEIESGNDESWKLAKYSEQVHSFQALSCKWYGCIINSSLIVKEKIAEDTGRWLEHDINKKIDKSEDF